MIQVQATMNAVRVIVIGRDIRAGKSARVRGLCSLLRIGYRFIHGIKFRLQNAPGSKLRWDQKNVSLAASAQNLFAEGPTLRPPPISLSAGTIPAWPMR